MGCVHILNIPGIFIDANYRIESRILIMYLSLMYYRAFSGGVGIHTRTCGFYPLLFWVIETKPDPLMLRYSALPLALKGLISKFKENYIMPFLGLCLLEEVMGYTWDSCTKSTLLCPFQTITQLSLPRLVLSPFLPYKSKTSKKLRSQELWLRLWWWFNRYICISKIIKLYTLKKYSFLYINHSSIKCIFKKINKGVIGEKNKNNNNQYLCK